ncbi:hypothetical protein AAMO2058_001562800 [Amorphochlora amoebiformis]
MRAFAWLSRLRKFSAFGLAGAMIASVSRATFTQKSFAEQFPLEEEIEEMSEPRHSHPANPTLTRVVADTLEEVCLAESDDVLLYAYVESCSKCKKLTTVINQVAKVFDDERHIVIASMDGDKNYKNGFFSDDVDDDFPIVVLYRAGEKKEQESSRLTSFSSPKAVVYPHSSARAEEIIRFLHTEGGVKFDLEKALQRSAELRGETRTELKKVIDTGLLENQSQIFQRGPCSGVLRELLFLVAYQTYTTPTDKDNKRIEVLQAERDKCFTQDRTYKYWEAIRNFSKSQLED